MAMYTTSINIVQYRCAFVCNNIVLEGYIKAEIEKKILKNGEWKVSFEMDVETCALEFNAFAMWSI